MSFVSFWAITGITLASMTVRVAKRFSFNMVKVATVGALVYFVATSRRLFDLRHWIEATLVPSPSESSSTEVVWATLLVSGLAVFPTYFAISLFLPWICNDLQKRGLHVGRVYGCNTAAFCIGLLAFTWWAPLVNIFFAFRLAIVLVVIGCLLICLVPKQAKWNRWIAVAGIGLGGVSVFIVPKGFDPELFPEGYPPRHYPVRAMMSNGAHTTYVVEGFEGDALYFDGHSMSSTNRICLQYMRSMAHVPLLAHPEPRRALLICFGVGNTAAAIAEHDSIEQIDIVDLNDRVFATATEFRHVNGDVLSDPRINLYQDDGRQFLRAGDEQYDLITSEPPPPMMNGISRLYSREYYADVLEHLTPDGMMSQWLPVYQMPNEAVEMAIATFVDVFPNTLMFVGWNEELILVGGARPFNPDCLTRRFREDTSVLADMNQIWIPTADHVLARIMMTDEMLRLNYSGARLISDDRNLLSTMFPPQNMIPAVPFDPLQVRTSMEARDFEPSERLVSAWSDLRILRKLVPDFPASSLRLVSELSRDIDGTNIDWMKIENLNRASSAALALGNIPLSDQLLKDSLAIRSDQLELCLDQGQRALGAGKFQAAEFWFQQAVRIMPELTLGRRQLATVYERTNRQPLADQQIRAIIQFDPDAQPQ
jgi:hypothetical protein